MAVKWIYHYCYKLNFSDYYSNWATPCVCESISFPFCNLTIHIHCLLFLLVISRSITEQGPVRASQDKHTPRPHVLPLPLVCRKTLAS